MPKVLIICESFPPQSHVGGLRPAMMAKYLSSYGWEPYIITRDYGHDCSDGKGKMSLGYILPNDHILRASVTPQEEKDYINTRGLRGVLRDIITTEKAFPPGVFDKMWAFAIKDLKRFNADIIWATFPNLPSLRLGRDLSERLAIPWVADFRDITEQNNGVVFGWRARLLRQRSILRRKMLVKNASRLTSVSSFHCRTLEKRIGKPCELIYNGYDADLFHPFEPVKTELFRIVYMGRILSKNLQNPCLFFEAIDELLADGQINSKHVEICFYATEVALLQAIAGNYRSWELCRFYERIDYNKVPGALNNASMLLLLSEYERHGILTTKFFEYLAIERPILCVRTEPDSEIATIIQKANAGYAGDNIAAVKNFILHYYNQWLSQGVCCTSTDREFVANFSREAQCKKLAQLLNRVVGYTNAMD